jgi:hypothetical protein
MKPSLCLSMECQQVCGSHSESGQHKLDNSPGASGKHLRSLYLIGKLFLPFITSGQATKNENCILCCILCPNYATPTDMAYIF